ncbi:hypothetical protein GQ53DRAFT_85595 [Thozetella sp. PMI_491]|nr:hypothetical protein GQ53DRAFT_85595 [Thozetella sp. PMI_491]
MPLRAHDRIPAFYSIFFLWIDPIVALWGTYLNLFQPATTMDSIVPRAIVPYDLRFQAIFQQLGGFLLGSAWIQIILQRYTRDVGVWKILHSGILIVDLVVLYSTWDALGIQGRRSLGQLRPEDWGTVTILGSLVVIRSSFLFGIGFPKASARDKRL